MEKLLTDSGSLCNQCEETCMIIIITITLEKPLIYKWIKKAFYFKIYLYSYNDTYLRYKENIISYTTWH